MLPGRKLAPENLGRVLVLGLGVSGKAVARYCLDLLGTRVEHVHIAGGAGNPDAVAFGDECRARGAGVSFDTEEISGTFDLCIASPGIPPTSAFHANARAASTELIGEVEFAWRESAAASTWLAVTGTNGKTTTTALLAHIMRSCGLRALPVGNIGDTCIEAVAAGACDYYVAEVSSYQLTSTANFAPDVAVLLNITPDHLQWHGSFDAYVEAKRAVLRGIGTRPGARAVFEAPNDIVRGILRELNAACCAESCVPVGAAAGFGADMRAVCGSPNAAFLRDGDDTLVVALDGEELPLCARSELLIPGMHNVGNALAAAAAALCAGAPASGVAAALTSFSSLEHRIEACGEVDGVRFYNDSKATNVDSTLKALEAFEPDAPIVLLGGRDKGTDLAPLVESACAHAKAVVCFGEARARFAAAFAGAPVACYQAPGMAEALACAFEHAAPGDIVLLSPACASFDEFASFEHRGTVFKQLVGQLSRKE